MATHSSTLAGRNINNLRYADAAKSLQSCPTLCDHIDGSPSGSPVPGILQAKPGVGCRFLLQCMKVKSQSDVAQSCPTLSDPMDCSLPGSSVHGIFQARGLEWGAIAFLVTSINQKKKINYNYVKLPDTRHYNYMQLDLPANHHQSSV